MRTLVLLCTALAGAAPSFAQSALPVPGQTAQGDVAVTIYNNNRALIEDKRQLNLPAGRSRQEFRDVSAQIQPETVSLNGRGVGIIEQNFDFDLLTPAALMQNAVGQEVTLVRVNPASGAEVRERARILAANGGVVLQIGDRIEVLRDDGLPARVIFDQVPGSLRARPTLSVTVQSDGSGPRPVTLTYLTPGLGWAADYVALFDEANGRMDVQGWVTLTNNSGTPYVNASTLLVAGAVGQTNPYQQRYYGGGYPPPPPPPPPPFGRVIDRAGTETAGRERLGDFYLYPLPERTTIADKQTKQVSFLDVHNAPAVRAYEFNNGWLTTSEQPLSASTVLRFSSSREGGLGDALPAGTVRVYQRDARGNPQFVGEHAIGHTPMGSQIGLETGQAFDVKVRPVVEERTRVSSNRWKTRMRYTLTNATPKPITVDLFQSGLVGDTRVSEESMKSVRPNADQVRWSVPVPANGEATVTATFDSRY
ncbi:MAG TPA: DUF4139 domain-containing protein [Sphingomicrobium sp.]